METKLQLGVLVEGSKDIWFSFFFHPGIKGKPL
jgi:hypothetical protein